jgi:hypothetical protein
MSEPTHPFLEEVERLTRDFTGREWVFQAIDTWLADPKGPTFFIITGEPGIGKTAIAARLTQVRDLAAYHFCRARESNRSTRSCSPARLRDSSAASTASPWAS